MADESPPEGPIQGNAHTSDPTTDQEDSVAGDDPVVIHFLKHLAQQTAGDVDFDRDFGFIKNEDDFEQRLREHETMNDKPETRSDYPTDPKTQREWVLKIAKALLNLDGATDTTAKPRKQSKKSKSKAKAKSKSKAKAKSKSKSKSQSKSKSKSKSNADAQDENDHDENDPDKDNPDNDNKETEKDSIAVTFLKSLTLAEIELVSWKIMTISRDVQEGRISRGTFGYHKLKFTDYDSWRERIKAIIKSLKTTKTVARAVVREGDLRIRDFVASPGKTTDGVNRNKKLNDGRAKEKAAAKEARERALREDESQVRSSIAAVEDVPPAPANSQDPSASEALGSDDTEDSTHRPNHAGSTSASAEKQASAVSRGRAAGQRTRVPSARGSSAAKGSMASLGGVKKSAGSPAGRLAKPPSPGASSSKASVPNKHNAGTNYKMARSSNVLPNGRHPLPEFRGHKPGYDPLRDNEFLPQSSKKKPSRPAPTAGLASKADQASGKTSRTTIDPLPRRQSYPSGVPLQDFFDLSFLGGGPREGGILASLSPAKKRPRALSRTQEDGPGPNTGGTGGTGGTTTARKKQKQDSAGKGTSHDPYDFEQDHEDDEDEDEDEEWFSADSS